MASGQKREVSDKSKVIDIEYERGKGSAPPQLASVNGKGERKKNGIGEPKKNGKGEQKTNGNKKKKGKGNANVFDVHDINFNGGKNDKCGVSRFGNKYYGRKKPESSEEESDSSDEDEE